MHCTRREDGARKARRGAWGEQRPFDPKGAADSAGSYPFVFPWERINGYYGDATDQEDQIVVPLTRATTEISATNPNSFEDAINEAIHRATSTLSGVEGAWVKDINVLISDGNIVGYKVNVAVTFMLESDSPDELEGEEVHRPTRRDSKYDSPAEYPPQHVLLKDLTEEEIRDSDRFLSVTPAKTGSGLKDVSVNHDRYLAED